MSGTINKKASEVAYLAGAGISLNQPSNLPIAHHFMSSLIKSVTDIKDYHKNILDRIFVDNSSKRFTGDFLRFEAVIGCIENAIDPELDILRVYSNCTLPNSNHFFLAKQLEQGAVILTTNFDNLIENACQELGVSYSLIVSDDELTAFSEAPYSFPNPLIKLHGGRDILYVDGRRVSGILNIKTTMEQFGRTYLDENSKPLVDAFSEVLKTRHLVIAGYSGCDDFDIMPLLMQDPLIKGMTWIEHQSGYIHPNIQEPDSSDLPAYHLIKTHHNKHSGMKIVQGNTSVVLGINDCKEKAGKDYDWTQVFSEWSKSYLCNKAHKQLLLGQLLLKIDQSKEGMQILENLFLGDLSGTQQMLVLFTLCNLYYELKDEGEAILKLSELTEMENQEPHSSLKGFAYYNLARINTRKGQYEEAVMYLDAAMKLFVKTNDIIRISDCLHELGRINLERGNADKAMQYMEEAKQYSSQIGLLSDTAIGYGETARALYSNGKLDEAEIYAKKAVEIAKLNGDQAALGRSYHTLGCIQSLREDFMGAIEMFQQAIKYEQIATAQIDLSHSLHSLGDMYMSINDYKKAKKLLQESLVIKRKLNDKEGISNSEKLLSVIRLYESLTE